MRDIKFRAWDKFNKNVCKVKEIDFERKTVTALYRNLLTNTYDFDEVELMQYTGLKDKSDKEIYKGDICVDARGFQFVVTWDADNSRFLGRGIGKHKEYIRYVGQEPAVTVIGNKYENPELLKVE